MSDASAAAALRSNVSLVVVEAPAGCGKTFQGSGYAADAAASVGDGRVLVLTHTHAACDVFASRTADAGRVEIRTVDSLIASIAAAYHPALDLPADPAAWARKKGNDGYRELAFKASVLLENAAMVARALAQRYPIVICDEHQDCSQHQHAIALALHRAGALLRVFGDPMQRIYGGGTAAAAIDAQRWAELTAAAHAFEALDTPHRWRGQAKPLGEWILKARDILRNGGQIDLRGDLPKGLRVISAENEARSFDVYQLAREPRKPIDTLVEASHPLLILAAHNKTVRALRAFFRRRIPIWEGHTREALTDFVTGLQVSQGDPIAIGDLVADFVGAVAVGFSPSAYTDVLKREIASSCAAKRRAKPATLQELASILIAQPNHWGCGAMLQRLEELIDTDSAFNAIKIDNRREFHDAIRIAQFDDADNALSEIGRRRTHARPAPPERAISTIHKAKGLECANVIVMPCDARHFANTEAARCLLYVAISRAMETLTLVVSKKNPSPLLLV